MFKAVKCLNQKPFENPKGEDENGKLATNPDDIMTIVATHFKNKFHNIDIEPIQPFVGEPKLLNDPISPHEVKEGIKHLNNNRAPGDDDITAELLKCGTFIMYMAIADILNEALNNHQELDINSGILITLPKPGKPKGPAQNLRPIMLLNTIRKTLSTIVLNRIRPKIERYLPHSQSGFRSDRSTADVVWTHKWLAAKAIAENIEIKITGIDMSAAFDTIDRHLLLRILEDVVDEDDLRMVRFLLSNTNVNTKINGATNQQPFTSNIGTPQGDCLSPVLFTIYLEHAMKEVRKVIPRPDTTFERYGPSEISYADDVDFISQNHIDTSAIQSVLTKYNLKVNIEKTELTTLSRLTHEWKTTKKVGSLIGDEEDIERRKQLSSVALYKLTNVWIRQHNIKKKTRLKLYRALVKPILLYNSGTWAMTKAQENKIDTFHRKQLKKILNIRYPTKISNKSLYEKCNEKPLSIQILESRWRLFGHILRRSIEIPANKAMTAYFVKCGDHFRGRPPTTLPVVLNNNLSHAKMRLKTPGDLEHLRALAQDRQKWRALTTQLVETADATQSVDGEAKGQSVK